PLSRYPSLSVLCFSLSLPRPPPTSTLFPYTTLFRSDPVMSSVPLARRALGPDLARGISLLGIALANMVGWLHGQQWTVLLKQRRSEEHTSELQSRFDLVCRLLLEKKKNRQ